MQKIIFLLLTATLFFTTSCKKDKTEQYYVSGQVLEYGTNEPIENALIQIFDCTTDGNFVSCQLDTTFTTNASGSYRSPFKSESGRYPVLTVQADKYYESTEYSLTEYRDNELDVVLDPHAWLNLHVKNVMPSEEFDKIRFSYEFGRGMLGGWQELTGSNIDEDFFNITYGGNKFGVINWKLYNSGILLDEFSDSIYIPAHDTLSYEILY